jgi:Flp pilus assembly pilin Flp
MTHRLAAALTTRWLHATRDERGALSIEAVLFAVALIALAGLVIGAITSFVSGEAAKIGGN